jgi:hypothetical protein
MSDFYFKRLTISGSGKEPSSVDFEQGVNIVFGPSDTGKSYIAECIDYMFGADKLRFDKTNGFDTFTLLVSSEAGDLTIERKLDTAKMKVASMRPDIESGEYTANWNKKSKRDDISDVWLKLLGIEDRHEIIKNNRRDKIRLTFRQFSHMFLIKETPILQEGSIITPVQKTVETAAFSSLYFLLTGEDFSNFTPKEEKKIREAKKKAVIDYMNAQLSEYAKKKAKLSELPDGDEDHLKSEIDRMISELEETERKIAQAMGRSKSLLDEMYQLTGELTESNTLRASYQELRSQYQGDIRRLANIVDGESHRHELDENTTCPYCDSKIEPRQEKSYVEASQAELANVRGLLQDLQTADNDLADEQTSIQNRIDDLSRERSGVENLVKAQLKPKAESIKRALVGYRYAIEIRKEADVIGDMETNLQQALFKAMTEEDPTDNDFKIKSYFDASFFREMNAKLDELLKVVKYEKYSTVHLDTSKFDLVVNGQKKMVHGKGYRAFQNTVMALALAEYLDKQGRYAPSMLIIDSPIQSLEEGVDDRTPDTMKIGLFKYLLEKSSLNQVIILENKIPQSLDYSRSNIVEFTKGKKPGRYGLLRGVQS